MCLPLGFPTPHTCLSLQRGQCKQANELRSEQHAVFLWFTTSATPVVNSSWLVNQTCLSVSPEAINVFLPTGKSQRAPREGTRSSQDGIYGLICVDVWVTSSDPSAEEDYIGRHHILRAVTSVFLFSFVIYYHWILDSNPHPQPTSAAPTSTLHFQEGKVMLAPRTESECVSVCASAVVKLPPCSSRELERTFLAWTCCELRVVYRWLHWLLRFVLPLANLRINTKDRRTWKDTERRLRVDRKKSRRRLKEKYHIHISLRCLYCDVYSFI